MTITAGEYQKLRTKRKPRHHESSAQQAVVRWARSNPEASILYAIPNGGQRGKVTASILKAEGVLAGMPDLHLPISRAGLHSLYIEMKHGDNKPSAAQKAMIARLRAEGHAVSVCYSAEEAICVIEEYLKLR